MGELVVVVVMMTMVSLRILCTFPRFYYFQQYSKTLQNWHFLIKLL